MSSFACSSRKSTPVERLSPLLSHIAGVIENVKEATFSVIKNEIESDLGKKLSDTEIVKALENGIKLGVFNIKREFKVCREFTTKELKKSNFFEHMDMLKGGSYSKLHKNRKMIIDYVRRERQRRRNKINEKRKQGKVGLTGNEYSGKNKLNEYLCHRCRKSLEKEMSNFRENSEVTSEENENLGRRNLFSSLSEMSDGSSQDSEDSSEKDTNAPGKSRLLVEKNPMETDPPYCDIFT